MKWLYKKYILLALIVCAGLIGTMLTAAKVWELQRKEDQLVFKRLSDKHVKAIENTFEHSVHISKALESLYKSSDSAHQAELKIFADHLLKEFTRIPNFQWIPQAADPSSPAFTEVHVRELIDRAVSDYKADDVRLAVFDLAKPVGDQLIYMHTEDFKLGTAEKNFKHDLLGKSAVVYQIAFNGKNWEIIAYPGNEGRYLIRHWETLGLVVTGILLTAMMVFVLFMFIKREEKVSRLVQQRTLELASANATLSREVEQRRHVENMLAQKALEAQMIFQITEMVTQTNSFEDSLKGCVDLVCQLLGWPLGHVYIPRPNASHTLKPADIWHCRDIKIYKPLIDETMTLSYEIGEGLPGRILETGAPAWIENIQEENRFPRSNLYRQTGIKSAFGFPIIVFNNVVAVFEFFNTQTMQPDRDLLRMINNVRNQVGHAIERKSTQMQLKLERDRLQLFQTVTVNRELEMIELKKENNELSRQLGRRPPHDLSFLTKGAEHEHRA